MDIGLLAKPKREGTEVKFFTNSLCPYAQRVWITLLEKDVDFEIVEIDLNEKPEWFTRLINPSGKVPVVIDVRTGKITTESRDICLSVANEYKERGTEGLVPEGSDELSNLRAWGDFVDMEVVPAYFSFLKSDGGPVELEDDLLQALQSFDESIAGPWILGNQFTLADIVALPFFYRLEFALEEYKKWKIPPAFTSIHAWMKKGRQRKSIQSTMPAKDDLKPLYNKLLQISSEEKKVIPTKSRAMSSRDTLETMKAKVEGFQAQLDWQSECIRILSEKLDSVGQGVDLPPSPLVTTYKQVDETKPLLISRAGERLGPGDAADVSQELKSIADQIGSSSSPISASSKDRIERELGGQGIGSEQGQSKSGQTQLPLQSDQEETADGFGKAIWYASEALGKATAFVNKQRDGSWNAGPADRGESGNRERTGHVDRTKKLAREEALTLLREDCDNAYFISGKCTADLYDEDCEFADPFASFRGYNRFAENLANLQPFVNNAFVKLLDWKEIEGPPFKIMTRFMVRLSLGLPWQPELAWVWGVEYQFSEKTGRVERHLESWEVSPSQGIQQLLRPRRK